MRKDRENPLRMSKSEARLKNIKSGQNLSSTLKTSKKPEAETEKPKEVDYEPVESLLYRKPEKLSSELTPAMKEYISSKYFSPTLERKKYENIEKFFIEKYQIINSIFHDSKSKPTFATSLKTDERKTGDSPDRVKEKEKNGDILDVRIRIIDEMIRKNVEDEINREMKRNEQEFIGINLQQKKTQKRQLSLTDKFFTLNMKSRFILDNLTRVLNSQGSRPKKDLSKAYFDLKDTISTRKFDDSLKSPSSTSRFKFPSINKRSYNS